jgi:hypothetical protein
MAGSRALRLESKNWSSMDVLALFADRKYYEGGGKRAKKRHHLDGRKPKQKRRVKKPKAATFVEQRPKYSAWMHSYPGCDPDLG